MFLQVVQLLLMLLLSLKVALLLLLFMFLQVVQLLLLPFLFLADGGPAVNVVTLFSWFAACYGPEVGKHPDLMVGPPTSTVFPTNDRKFEIPQFFRKKFEKI
jgi:hypothetical protein